jgi:general stress protein 26
VNANAKRIITELRQGSNTAYVASINDEGYPVLRAMLVLEHDSLKTQFFSTNTSSAKVRYYQRNPKASVYYCRTGDYKGVLFVGEMQVCQDQQTKDFLWREGFEHYYPKGVTDPDYCVLRFTAADGSFFGGPDSTTFTIDELKE